MAIKYWVETSQIPGQGLVSLCGGRNGFFGETYTMSNYEIKRVVDAHVERMREDSGISSMFTAHKQSKTKESTKEIIWRKK